MLTKKKRNALAAFQANALPKSKQHKIKGGNGGASTPPPPPDPIVIDEIADF